MKPVTSTVHKVIALAILIIFNIGGLKAQSKKAARQKEKLQEVQKLIDSKRFTFKVQTVQPMRGGSINITSDYELEIKKDTLNSYLPYYGRAFTAPMNPTESGLIFTTQDFDYNIEKKKKGMKNITIVPKNRAQYARQFNLTVSELGYATLQVTANNRDAITYTGYIAAAD